MFFVVRKKLRKKYGASPEMLPYGIVGSSAIAVLEPSLRNSSFDADDVLKLETRLSFKQSIINSVSAQIAVLDDSGIIMAVNDSWYRFSIENGTSRGKPTLRTGVGVSYLDICRASVGDSAEGARIARDGIQSVLDGRSADFTMQYPCHSLTQRRWFILSATPIGDKKRHGVVIAHTDITQIKLAEEELALAAIAFESQEGMLITDANRVIIKVNDAFTKLTGYSSEEALGQTPSLLNSGRHEAVFYRDMWRIIDDKHYWQGEMWNRRKDGRIYAEWLTISAVAAQDGSISNYVGSFSDITQDTQAAAEIHRLAYYDPLTRLPNRRLVQDRLGQAVAASGRSGLYGAVLFLNLDNFKAVNDAAGREVGDLLLIGVAQRLRAVVRESDTLARLGGDEFVAILEDLSANPEDAALKAKLTGEKLNEAIAQPFNLNGIETHQTICIGIGLFCRPIATEELLKHADLALHQAKAAGRNAICFYDVAMQEAVNSRSDLLKDLRQAIKQEQFELHYQPQVDSANLIIGAEALVRWRHPKRGMVLPGEFIPLAEETELILPLGRWVMKAACAQLALWATDTATSLLTVAVNVSARQFRQADFVEEVQAILINCGALPERLKIELTESMLVDNVDEIIRKMTTLKILGVGFSLDDFGTGFSSLSYLKRLPLDQLKIDRSFVRDVLTDTNDAAIVKTVVALAQSLGLGVIAEGVETEAQRDFLRASGCHHYQGYLFCKPVPRDVFERLVKPY